MKSFFQTPLISLVLVFTLMGQPIWAQAPVSVASDAADEGANLQLRVTNFEGDRIPVNSRSAKGITVQITDSQGVPAPEAAVAFRLPDSGASGVFPDGSHSAVVYTDSEGMARIEGIQWNGTPGAVAIRITASKGNAHTGLLLEETLVSPSANSVAATAEPVRSAPLPSLSPTPQAAAPLAAPSISVEPVGRKGMSKLDSSLRRPEMEPSVSIVSSPEATSIGSSKKKWIILGIAIAAGAGAGFAFANKGKSSSTPAATSSISFGSPTVSVGHP